VSTFQFNIEGRAPNADTLLRIHKTYGVNINWLLTGEGEPYGTSEENFGDRSEASELIKMTREIIGQDSEFSQSLKANIRMSYQALKAEERYHDLEARMRQLEEASADQYMPDRRKGQRRTKNDPDAIPGNIDRRSGMDRRVAVTKS